jgi:hypothetical protein
MTDQARDHSLHPRRKINILGRTITLPRSKPLRMSIGGGLVVFGFLGFLPVLGFWMIPLGLMVLSHDLPWARRRRRRLDVWWEKRRRSKAVNGGKS